MTNEKTEFPGVTIDASEPARVDCARVKLDPSMNVGIGLTIPTYTASLSFHAPGKEVMQITAEGVWVDPDLTTDEAAKAVIAALDKHIKFMFSKRDAVMRMALKCLKNSNAVSFDDLHAIKALEEQLKCDQSPCDESGGET